MDAERFLRVVGSPEIYLKSRVTQSRFIQLLAENLRAGLRQADVEAKVSRTGVQELRVDGPDLAAASAIASTTFGIGRINQVEAIPYEGLDDLAASVAERTRERVTGHTFAVRVQRRGTQEWASLDAERLIGSLLFDDSAGVDLTSPEEKVAVRAADGIALLVIDEPEPPNGLPMSSQEKALALLSGGIDSPVAAWMMMRAGCPIDFLHLEMECSVTDQALAVGHELIRKWGHGMKPRFHVIDFQPVKEALLEGVEPRFRQVVLKQLMLQTGERMARSIRTAMLVTGDSLGQVSSQTGAHLVEMDRSVDIPVLRPLVALRKEEIVGMSRRIGTYEMSIRTREVCDLSDGHRVATRASKGALAKANEGLGSDLLDTVFGTLRTVEARKWTPGVPIEPAS